MQLLKEIDPVGVELRRKRCLKRRVYSSKVTVDIKLYRKFSLVLIGTKSHMAH